MVAAEEKGRVGPQLYYSAGTLTEAILYAGMAATQKKNGIVTDGSRALAWFLKAFALVDLNRGDEALPALNQALALAPMNAQYLAERAEWYKARHRWDDAFRDFESASSAAELAPDDRKATFKGRALRGMAFVKVEQGDLGAAEKYLKQALKLNPADERARTDLADVGQRRLQGKR